MLPHPLRAGLAGLIDYAGLFPPASLDLPTTLSHFRDYATSAEQWMLGPADRAAAAARCALVAGRRL